MGKNKTPDIEQIGDIDRFCTGSWFASGDRCLHVVGIQVAENRVIVEYQGRQRSLGERVIPFEEFLDNVTLGVPASTYVVVEGTLQYVWINTINRTTQGYRRGQCRWDGFPMLGDLPDKVVVRQILFPEYTPYTEALRVLDRGDAIGQALAPNIGVISTPSGPYKLTYQASIIGEVQGGKPVVYPKYKHLAVIVESVCNQY